MANKTNFFEEERARLEKVAMNDSDIDLVCVQRKGGHISFIESFCYLGSTITPNLNDGT